MWNKTKIFFASLVVALVFGIIAWFSRDAILPEETLTEGEKERTVSELQDSKTGDIVVFGRYEQDANLENGQEPLRWIVLSEEGSKRLLITEEGIDLVPYHSQPGRVMYQDSYINLWLNTTFLETGFSSDEKNMIVETELAETVNEEYGTRLEGFTVKSFLVSVEEIQLYFGLDLKTEEKDVLDFYANKLKTNATDVVLSNPLFEQVTGYWIRTPGVDYDGAVYVSKNGYLSVAGDGCAKYKLVRPAMWVDVLGVN